MLSITSRGLNGSLFLSKPVAWNYFNNNFGNYKWSPIPPNSAGGNFLPFSTNKNTTFPKQFNRILKILKEYLLSNPQKGKQMEDRKFSNVLFISIIQFNTQKQQNLNLKRRMVWKEKKDLAELWAQIFNLCEWIPLVTKSFIISGEWNFWNRISKQLSIEF